MPKPLSPLARLCCAALVVASCTLAAAADADAQSMLPSHSAQLQANSHALGLVGGYPGASGFAYRHYFGDTFIQANMLPLVADRGDFLALMFGMQVGHYLLVWQQSAGLSLIPATTALRVVGVASTFFSRDATFVDAATAPVCVGATCPPVTTSTKAKLEQTSGLGAGIGFEFGGIRRHGFSFSLDLMLTATWDDEGFKWLVPIPYGSIMYSW